MVIMPIWKKDKKHLKDEPRTLSKSARKAGGTNNTEEEPVFAEN